MKSHFIPSEHAGARYFCSKLLQSDIPLSVDTRVLVAGCGHGMEAAYIHDTLGVSVDAFDLWLHRGSDLPTRDRLQFHECDISELPFDDEVYDVVFYHHVIEHVPDPVMSLQELSRVSKPDSMMFIGTPNRHRIVGAIGAHERTVRHKIRKNIQDWTMRLKGQFRNECGAHAGFSVRELDGMLSVHYPYREWVTSEYLRYKYSKGLRKCLAIAMTTGAWQEVAVPSIYAFCTKGDPTAPSDHACAAQVAEGLTS